VGQWRLNAQLDHRLVHGFYHVFQILFGVHREYFGADYAGGLFPLAALSHAVQFAQQALLGWFGWMGY
jgi:hypothetical protein